MPKRRSDERGGGRTRKARPIRRHLYLVLDDWSSGYTIRKIDLLLEPAADYTTRRIITGGFLGKQRLPPAVMRLEAPRGLPTHWVAAAGSSKLMFLQPPVDDTSTTKPAAPLCRDFVPVVDVRMRSTSFRPRPTDDPVDPIYMPVAGGGDDGDWRLFALDSRGAFSVLCPPPLDDPGQESWSWRALPDPPFERRHVVSYAGLPDSGLVVSTKANDDSEATFTFAMAGAEAKPPEWKRHHMFLPFSGRGHFDPVLDAFVGLSGAPGSVGHLCLVYMDGSQKLSKEKLFGEDSLLVVERKVKAFTPVERQVGSNLVYMGGRSNFCLVQCFCHGEIETNGSGVVETNGSKKDADQDVFEKDMIVDETTDDGKLDDDQEDVARHSCCLFRLTAFCLKYDENGDVGIVILRVQYFNVPEGVSQIALKNPAAFWM